MVFTKHSPRIVGAQPPAALGTGRGGPAGKQQPHVKRAALPSKHQEQCGDLEPDFPLPCTLTEESGCKIPSVWSTVLHPLYTSREPKEKLTGFALSLLEMEALKKSKSSGG